MKPFRIFISSPGDVVNERRRAILVVGRIKREFSRFLDISGVLWEYEPMLSSGHFQDIIEPPSRTDIVVLILWSRLGTPLPERTSLREYRGLDGHVPVTGTEWEFEEALNARKMHGSPDILVYRKLADGFARYSSAQQLEDARLQWEAVQTFWERHFVTPEGSFKAGFNSFSTLDEFEKQLEAHLQELIRRKLPSIEQADTTSPRRIKWWRGSPFAGLGIFEESQAAVFFGRDKAEREAIEKLSDQASSGLAFLIILGASGVGKSSLVRAGILPNLVQPGIIAGVSTWRRVIIQPSKLLPDLFIGLAERLLDRGALPEIQTIGYSASEVARQFRVDPQGAAVSLRLALKRAAVEDQNTSLGDLQTANLILVIDQFEEIFALSEISRESVNIWCELLLELSRSGFVWIIATMRSDFYHKLAEIPAIYTALTEIGQYLLAHPTGSELEHMIREPAIAAGLVFEKDRDLIGVDGKILDAAMQDANSLPLVSFVLDELYRKDIDELRGSVLTCATYEQLGGVEGAIVSRAEALVAELPPDLLGALPALLLSLVEIEEGRAYATARTVRRDSISSQLSLRLIDSFIQARLIVSDSAGEEATVRLAHEALLSRWPRLHDLISAQREFLHIRRRLDMQAARWRQEGADRDLLLPSGRQLFEATEILRDRRDELHDFVIEFINQSLAEDLHRQKVQIERDRAEGELEAGRRIQMSILPTVASVSGDQRFDLAALMVPARQIGGDLYDFFKIDADHLFFAIGDVSERGVPAALFMAVGKSLCKSAALRGETDIGAIVNRANAEISRDNPEMLFITLFAGILNLMTGQLSFCNAGHHAPILLRAGNLPQSIPGDGGPPLCVMEDFPYMTEIHQLQPGDLLCLTTDGVIQAMADNGTLMGRERAQAVLAEAPVDASAQDVVDGLCAAVGEFAAGAEQSDDITILAVRWCGTNIQ